jgi:hypothetical protein
MSFVKTAKSCHYRLPFNKAKKAGNFRYQPSLKITAVPQNGKSCNHETN